MSSKKSTSKPKGTKRIKAAPPPPSAAGSSKEAKPAPGVISGGRVVDGPRGDRARWEKKAQEAAAQQGTQPPAKPGKGRKAQRRIALVNKDSAAEITKAVADLPTSNGHVCWKRNGSVHELYYRMDGKTPTLFRAPADSPIDENGYRTKDASGNVTGVFHIKESIKQLTGKSPAQIGIQLPADIGAPKARSATTPASGKHETKPRKKREGLSGLDAAAQVLAKAKEPLSAKTIAERAIAAGWKTSGATPHATLYSAMIREIAAKGKDARFAKADKGLFTAAGKGA